MGFVSLSEIKKNDSSCQGRRIEGDLTFGVHFRGKNSTGKSKHSLTFVIREALMARSRIMNGDRVDVLFDPIDGVGIIKRNNEGLIKVHSAGSKSKQGKIAISLIKGMPAINKTSACDSVEITNEGIMFKLPNGFYIYNGDDTSLNRG